MALPVRRSLLALAREGVLVLDTHDGPSNGSAASTHLMVPDSRDGNGWTVLMKDIADEILRCKYISSTDQASVLIHRLAMMHATFCRKN